MRLNICIDIGNTSTKLGVFDNNEMVSVLPNLSDKKLIQIIEAKRPDNVMISSVRKGIGKIVGRSSAIANTIVLGHHLPLPIQINYNTPHTLGMDRICSAVAARFLYPKAASLVVDIGTCITYDLIDHTGTFQGGGISPGIELKLKAMHKFTSRLPRIAFDGEAILVGKSTKECMLSGAVNGTLAELEGLIARYRQFYDNLTIIFCGGGAVFFESKIKDHIFAIPNLVLIGLNQILISNLHD